VLENGGFAHRKAVLDEAIATVHDLSVCWLVITVIPAKMAELIKIWLGTKTPVGPRIQMSHWDAHWRHLADTVE